MVDKLKRAELDKESMVNERVDAKVKEIQFMQDQYEGQFRDIQEQLHLKEEQLTLYANQYQVLESKLAGFDQLAEQTQLLQGENITLQNKVKYLEGLLDGKDSQL